MISKIFFTMLVIVIVGVLFSKQRSASTQSAPKTGSQPTKENRHSLSPQHMAYGLVGLLLMLSAVIYYVNRNEANQVITLNVLDASGTKTQYQAYQKNIHGRTFTTIDHRQVQLAETDRLEVIRP